MGQFKQILLLVATTALLWEHSLSFVVTQQQQLRPRLSLDMAAAAGGNKKRRRRKDAPTGATALDPIKLEQETVEGIIDEDEEAINIATEEQSQFDLKPDGIAQGTSPLCQYFLCERPSHDFLTTATAAYSVDSSNFLQEIEEVAQFNFKNRDDILKGA